MQTSQDVLARRHLERLTQLAPEEPAGWANLGLLLLRQQQIDEAISESRGPPSLRRGTRRSTGCSRGADAEGQHRRLDPTLAARSRARSGGSEGPLRPGPGTGTARRPAEEAEAQRILASLVDRSGNLAAASNSPGSPRNEATARPLGRSRRVRTRGPLVAGRRAGPSAGAPAGGRRRAGERRDAGDLPEERADSLARNTARRTPP